MKYLGQHIENFIAKFRQDVYLESVSNPGSDTDKFLVIDSDGKIGQRTGAEVASDIGVSGTFVDLTSEVTGALPVSNGGTGATTLTSNAILTGNGTSAIQAESTLSYASQVLLLGSGQDSTEATITRALAGSGDVGGDLNLKAGQGNGTNKLGGDLNLYGGTSTGAAGGGKIAFFASPGGGASGATPSTQAEVGSISNSGNLQIDGSITVGSTSFVNSSGVVQVATQGTIDHDSLANFVAAEHVDWAGASAGTIHATNYSNTMGSGFTVSATTDSNATTITQGDDLFFAAGTGITCETTADGTVTITNTVSDTNTQLSTEQVQDIVGAMLVGTETRIGVTYDDTNGRINFVVDDMTADTNTNQLTTFTLTGDGGSDQTIAHGNTLDIAGGNAITTAVGATDTVTINHDDTSSQASVNNSGSTYIQDVTLDTYGHVTGLTSAAIPTLNQDTTGQAGTVATIAGLAPNTATTAAAQPNITSLGTLTALTVDDITIDGDTITASADLNIVATGNDIDIDTDNFTLESSGGNKPNFTLKTTSGGNKPATFNFTKDKGAAGAANDSVGLVLYTSDNDAQEQTTIASTLVTVDDATDGAEEGKYSVSIKNTSSSGTRESFALTGNGTATDATIGFSDASVTTITGTLTMGSTATLDNSGILQTAAQTNITSLGTLTALTVDNINLNDKTITVTGDTDDTFSIVTGAAGATTLTTHDQAGTAGHFEIAADGDITLDAAADISLEAGGSDISISADHVTITSSSAQDPQFKLISTTNDANGCQLQLRNNKGAAGADGDGIGSIRFIGDDTAQTQTEFGKIICQVSEADDTDEAGKMRVMIATSDGTTTALTNALILEGEHATAGEVDVTIAAGAASTTTVSGNLKVTTGIELGHASDTTIARSAAGTVTIEGNPIQTTNVHHHFLNAGFFMSLPFSRYIPLNGSINEQNTSTSSPEYTHFTWPYDGFVKKMMLRTETDMGSTELKLYKGASGAAVTTALGAVTETVAASNAVEFDFTSVSNTYSKGDTMAIRVDPTDDPDGGQNITIELVFDLTT